MPLENGDSSPLDTSELHKEGGEQANFEVIVPVATLTTVNVKPVHILQSLTWSVPIINMSFHEIMHSR